MPPVSPIGNSPPVQPALGGGVGHHGTNAVVLDASAGQSFETALAQAVNQAPGGSAHGNHSGSAGSNGALSHSSGRASVLSVQGGGSHPRHFQIGEANHGGGGHSLQEVALGLRGYRQQLIASNIANADTPGYKALDVDIHEALRIARSIADTPPLTLLTTASGHISGHAQTSASLYPLKYHIPSQPSADGNTVEMDVERSKFAENSLMWEFARDRVSGHYKHMMEMFLNLKD
ncbi:flagellar basal body rod protein FlgB [Sulfuritalea sp.]|uniref:flagellar basal body rod protein FlgB n=1 Tax=Sulfuritalea sp. TaxID=2480090 RepID=UPI001ACADDF4|nr:flagellar basal body rod protein FlgB [Sulfuritalea sp.]MBN8475745.1 flagellar basal body rod protein FlgB [Sulfuritalea sp.]